MFSRFKQEACEIQCRLCLGRIKLMRNKRTLQLQQSRKEVANLLKTGKQEYARIRVEGVIREQLMLQAYEILELYMELLSVRAQLISKTKEIPRDMVEAISSIIYAAQRVGDLPELTKLRKMFEVKYGQQYVQEANNDATSSKWQVNNNLIRCLLVEPPEAEDKLANLSEIAQEHGVEWDLSAAARELLPPPPPVPTPPNFEDGAPVPGYPNMAHQAVPSYGAGHNGMPPGGTAQGQYTDANQAAAAAAYAATQARAAADYAAQFVMHQAGLSAPAAAGAAAAPSNDAVSDAAQFAVQQAGLAAPDGPPPSWYVPPDQAGAIHRPQGPHSYPGTDPHGGTPGQNGGGPGFANGGAAGQQTVNYQPGVARSDEDIQRAYDEALGAPAKFGSSASAPMPPSPPPAVPDLPPPPPLSHVPPPTNPNSLNLPAPPKAGVQPGAPNQPEDEYEALTRRLEALKRS